MDPVTMETVFEKYSRPKALIVINLYGTFAKLEEIKANCDKHNIGPRPALWNQYDLIEERDKYGANDVPVGLTGWAQING